jgi:4-amino-4-deoxy-L-arabinose transferase-like glycosyltransferase
VYLLLFAAALVLTPRLAASPQTGRIALAVMGLNPIAGTSLIFGENDPFVLGWLVIALWLLQSRREVAASAVLGLACASKPTAWFLAPFWLMYLLRDSWGSRPVPPVSLWPALLKILLRRAWPLPVVLLLIIGPWLAWNPAALYDDVWRWSAGLGPTGYQIWGWGASNFVLALGWVSSRFDYWPFTIPGTLVSVPLLGLLLWRQARANTMAAMLYGSVVLLLPFFYVSRFLQPNYLGYLLGLAVLAIVIEEKGMGDKR